MATASSPRSDTVPHYPEATMPASAAATGRPASTPPVGHDAQDDDAARELRIVQLGESFKAAYAMFEATGLDSHRAEAYRLLRLQEQAIKGRSARAQAERHAAFERQLEEGVDFFQSAAAQQLGRTAGGRQR